MTSDSVEKGRRVREARQAKGLLQKDLAAAINAPASTISHIEKGRVGVTRERAEALGPLLGLNPDELAEVASPSLLASIKSIETLLLDRHERPRVEASGSRSPSASVLLEGLRDSVAAMLETQTTLVKDLADVRDRLRLLEEQRSSRRGRGQTSPTGTDG